MKRVIIESPYAGHGDSDYERRLATRVNITYARACVRDSVIRGEAPIASHLLFTQAGILNDDIPAERELGIAAGLAWREVADLSVFYTDRGWSRGMLAALDSLGPAVNRTEIRALFGPIQWPPARNDGSARTLLVHEGAAPCR